MIQWSARGYSADEFREAWLASVSIAECLRRLGLTIYGSSYPGARAAAAHLGLDESHMTGKPAGRTSAFPEYRPLDQILVKGVRLNSAHLKARLIREGVLQPQCAAPFCPVPNPSRNPFTGEPAPLKLTLDHVNGDNTDNRLENLRLLCHHCHAETATYCRGQRQRAPKRVRSKSATENHPTRRETPCACGAKKSHDAERCKPCEGQRRLGLASKIDWPSDEDLVAMVSTSSRLAVAQRLGVSNVAVGKRLRKRGLVTVKVVRSTGLEPALERV